MLSIYTEVNVYFNTWTKFLRNNRPPSKLPPHWSPLFIRMFGSRECYMHLNAVFHPGVILNKWFLYYSHQRKQPTFRDATVGSTWKWRLTNKRRNSILMTYQYQDLGSASGPSRSKAEKRYPLNKKAIRWIGIRETNCIIQWVAIYPVDSVIHPLIWSTTDD